MQVIALFDYHTLKKSTKYETCAELYTQVSYFVLFTLSHIRDAICRDNLKSAYAISSFPPTGYQPAVMVTRSHVF